MMANNRSNKPKNDYNYRQCQMSSQTDVNSELRPKGLESTKGLEPTAKPGV